MFSFNYGPQPEYTSFKLFQFLGYFVGGLIPIYIFLSLEVIGFGQHLIQRDSIGPFLLTLCIGEVIGVLAFWFEHLFKDNNNKWFRFIFLLQAIYSIFLIHTIVIYTGGPRISVFSASYLYLLAIVGYTYGSGPKLYWAFIFILLSYFTNLWFITVQKPIFDNVFVSNYSVFKDVDSSHVSDFQNMIIYAIIFTLQISVTVFTVTKKNQKSKQNFINE